VQNLGLGMSVLPIQKVQTFRFCGSLCFQFNGMNCKEDDSHREKKCNIYVLGMSVLPIQELQKFRFVGSLCLQFNGMNCKEDDSHREKKCKI
jgi:hypothetical protein